MVDGEDDPYESTTRWLQEVARRPAPDRGKPSFVVSPPSRKERRERTILGVGREVYMFAVMAAAYANYYFMEVMVEIDSLPSIVVFISPSGPLG